MVSLFLPVIKSHCLLYRLYLYLEDYFGVDFKLAYHSLGCGDSVVAVERLDCFVVTHTDDSQFSDDVAKLS